MVLTVIRPYGDERSKPHVRQMRGEPKSYLRSVTQRQTTTPRCSCKRTVIAPVSSLTQSLTQPLADRGVFGVLVTSNMFATRPMKVTARGPGHRSRMSQSAYSTGGCHGSTGSGRRASSLSSAVKPSPTGASDGGADEVGLIGDELGVGGKKAWIDASPIPVPPIVSCEVI